jgi:hypothetical protein
MNKLITAVSLFAALLTSTAASAEAPPTVDSKPSKPEPVAAKNWFGDGMRDSGPHDRPNYFSAQVILGYGDTWGFIGNSYAYGFAPGVAARYTIHLLPNGFISSLNDSFDLDVGADARFILGGVVGYNSYGSFGIGFDLEAVAEVKWVMYFLNNLGAYVHAGIGAGMALTFAPGFGFSLPIDPQGGVGLMFRITNSLMLRADLVGSWHYEGLRVGLVF